MNDLLAQLLRDADAASVIPELRNDLAGAVRRRRARQVRVRIVAASTLALLIIAAMWIPTRQRSGRIAIAPLPSLAGLDIDAQVHELTAQKLATVHPASSRFSDSTSALEQRDRAALILVYEADRYLRDARPTDAIASYQRAIDLFPTSHWADVARKRLKQIQSVSEIS